MRFPTPTETPSGWVQEDADLQWTYGHNRGSALGESHIKDLLIKFDAKGTVESYPGNPSLPEDRDELYPR